jgi:hypothetical protein
MRLTIGAVSSVDVSIDEKECCPHLFARKHIQQVRGGRRIRPVVVSQVDGCRRSPGHVPHGAISSHGVQDERRWGGVSQRHHREAEEHEYQHQRLVRRWLR